MKIVRLIICVVMLIWTVGVVYLMIKEGIEKEYSLFKMWFSVPLVTALLIFLSFFIPYGFNFLNKHNK